MTHSTPQRGFVLLMVLVLLSIAAAVLAGVARHSAMSALDARDEEQALQYRWATRSLAATIPPRIETILARQEGSGPPRSDATAAADANTQPDASRAPVPEWRGAIELAGRRYLIVLTDEQAKLNLNRVVEEQSLDRAAGYLRRLTQGANPIGGDRVRLELRPNPMALDHADHEHRLPRFGSFDQVFAGASPDSLIGRQLRRGYAAKFTCWGDGRLNIRRADAEVIRAACAELTQARAVDQLIAARDANPYRPLDAMLDEAGIKDEDVTKYLTATLTDEANCHGMWIVAQQAQRDRFSFYVVFSSRSSQPGRVDREVSELIEFAW